MIDDRPFGPQLIWVLAVVLAAIAFAATPIFVRQLTAMGTPPEVVTFFRYVVLAAVLLPFISLRLKKIGAAVTGVLAGLAMGLGWVAYVITLGRAEIAPVGVLYLSFPFFAIVFTLLFRRWRPGTLGVGACLLILVACWLVLMPDLHTVLTPIGVLIALAPAAGMGVAIAVSKTQLTPLNLLQRLGSVALGACLAPVPFIILQYGPDRLMPAGGTWGPLLGLSVLTALLPALLYMVAAPRVGAIKGAFAGGIELPAMAFFAWWLMGEMPTERVQIAAGLIVLATVLLGFSSAPKGRPPAA